MPEIPCGGVAFHFKRQPDADGKTDWTVGNTSCVITDATGGHLGDFAIPSVLYQTWGGCGQNPCTIVVSGDLIYESAKAFNLVNNGSIDVDVPIFSKHGVGPGPKEGDTKNVVLCSDGVTWTSRDIYLSGIWVHQTQKCPGGGGGQQTCTKPTGVDALNPINWLSYYQCLLSNAFNSIGTILGSIATDIGKAIAAALTAFWNTIFTGWTDFWKALTAWFVSPIDWLGSILAGLFKESSPSVIHDLATNINDFLTSIYNWATGHQGSLKDPVNSVLNQVSNLGATIGQELSTPTNPDTVQARIVQLDTLVTKLFLSLTTGETVMEGIPGMNRTGIMHAMLAYMEARGLNSIIRGTLLPYIEHNLNTALSYKLNADYHNILPDLATQIALRNKGYWSSGAFQLEGPRVSGIPPDELEQLRVLDHQEPTFIDFITWNRRHPDKPYDLSQHEDLIAFDLTRWGTVLEERQYADPSLRELKTNFILGFIKESDVDCGLTRLGKRKDLLPGQTKSDFDASKAYVTGGQILTVDKIALTAKLRLYLKGLATESDLQTAAARVYEEHDDLDTYMQGARDRKTLVDATPKHFTYTVLIKLAEAGIDIAKFTDADLAATGLDDDHQAALKDYIDTTVKAKKAMTG